MKFKLLATLGCVFAFLLVFIVPFFIKPFKKTVSSSFDYQFNNIISVLFVYLILFVVVYLYIKYKERKYEQIGQDLIKPENSNLLGIKYLWMMCALFLAIISFLYLCRAGYGFGEMHYFLLRIDRLMMGQVPYKDFEYAYGVTLIYIPFFISKIFGLSTVNSYYLFYIILNYLGLHFLHYIINSFNIPVKVKRNVFIAFAAMFLPLCMGLNYTPFRFVTPIFFIIILNNLVELKYKNTLQYVITIALSAFCCLVIVFTISMEICIAFGAGVAFYFFVSFLKDRKIKDLLAGALYIILIIVGIAFFNDNILLTLKTFAAGGNNFVIIPCLSILLYVAAFLFSNTILASYVIQKKVSFIHSALLIFNLALLPGAFGRCDPPHIFYYGIGSLIFAISYLAYIDFKFYKLLYLLVLIAFPIGYDAASLFYIKESVGRLCFKVIASDVKYEKNFDRFLNKLNVNPKKIDSLLRKYEPIKNFELLDQYQVVSLPFDADENVYTHLLKNKTYAPEYYTGFLLNVYTQEQIDNKLAQLKNDKHTYMVVPRFVFDFKPDHDLKTDRKFLSILFLFPYNYSKKQFSQDMYNPIINYVKSNYSLVGEIGNHQCILRRIK